MTATNDLDDPIGDAEARGHTVEKDPPHFLSKVERWTCTRCGRAVLRHPEGNIYGSALEADCDG